MKNKDLFFETYLKWSKKLTKDRPKYSEENTKMIGVVLKNQEEKHLNGAKFQGRCKIYKNTKGKWPAYSFLHNNEFCVPHCRLGVMKYSDGHVYTGEWKDGRPFGNGEYINPEVGRYYGMWNKGMMNGWGEFEYKDGNKFKGEFVDSKWKGLGTLKTDKGKISRGYFKDSFELEKNGQIESYVLNEADKDLTYE